MCEYSQKLVVWLDRELSAEETTEVERHLEGCSECRSCADEYKKVSVEFDAYCDAAMASTARPGAPHWMPVAAAAGALSALAALFFAMPRTRIEPPAFHAQQAEVATSPAIVGAAAPTSVSSTIQRVHRRQAIAPVQIQNANAAPAQNQNAYVLPDEPMIQIAIPADEMFPPGAVPEGIHFVADLTIAADGSAERLRLRPRLAAFESRTTQP
jgi:anti-sigma factor RsiW